MDSFILSRTFTLYVSFERPTGHANLQIQIQNVTLLETKAKQRKRHGN